MTTETQAHDEHHDPPYMLIFLVLLVVTLAEVGYAFLPLPQFWLVQSLGSPNPKSRIWLVRQD